MIAADQRINSGDHARLSNIVLVSEGGLDSSINR
jgi:hypothetical protein